MSEQLQRGAEAAHQALRDEASQAAEAGRFEKTYKLAMAGLVVSAISALVAAGGLAVAVLRKPAPVNVPAPVVKVVPVPQATLLPPAPAGP